MSPSQFSPIFLLTLLISSVSFAQDSLPLVAFIAGADSHGAGEHEHVAGGKLLVDSLNQSGRARGMLYQNGWPAAGLPDDVASVVLYMDGNESHEILAHLPEMENLMKEGVGLVAIHYAVHVPEAVGERYFDRWLGGYYHSQRSTNPHWTANVTTNEDHPVTADLSAFSAQDEFYFNIVFAADVSIAPLLTATPPAKAREHIPHPRRTFFLFGGTVPEEVSANAGREEVIAWAFERKDGGRSVGYTGGHFHDNWKIPQIKQFIVNAMAWTAGAELTTLAH